MASTEAIAAAIRSSLARHLTSTVAVSARTRRGAYRARPSSLQCRGFGVLILISPTLHDRNFVQPYRCLLSFSWCACAPGSVGHRLNCRPDVPLFLLGNEPDEAICRSRCSAGADVRVGATQADVCKRLGRSRDTRMIIVRRAYQLHTAAKLRPEIRAAQRPKRTLAIQKMSVLSGRAPSLAAARPTHGAAPGAAAQ